MGGKPVYLGFGCNMEGRWGDCSETFGTARSRLITRDCEIVARSANYRSPALGARAQPDFLNNVIAIQTSLPPIELLRALKSIERDAGRRKGPRWDSRSLDIDILDYRGLVLNWRSDGDTSRGAGLILPHPEMHKRAFVLKPLSDIAPVWRHPVLDAGARQLLARIERQSRHSAVRNFS